ncbi:MAG: MerR family transcriptional regulator [Neobacillus sp.]|jgi:MerR family transcriptional regulator, light-induced transcriptional regulator
MYSIKKVSELLNIPTVTIRAWENRYQVISPTRTEGGHRLYSDKDIATLRWLKEQVEENNVKISEAVRLLAQRPEKPQEESSSAIYDSMIERLYEALVDLNTQEANTLTDLAFSLYDYEEVFHHILTPVLYKIGDDWETGLITVAQEHFSSQFILHRCTQFFRILPVNPALPKALAFCPEGEQHHIGLMLFSLFLRKKGHDVIYLGPSTPYSGLLELIEMKDVSVVIVSLTEPSLFEEAMGWINTCLKKRPGLKFIIGGNGIHSHETLSRKSVFFMGKIDWEEGYDTFIK